MKLYLGFSFTESSQNHFRCFGWTRMCWPVWEKWSFAIRDMSGTLIIYYEGIHQQGGSSLMPLILSDIVTVNPGAASAKYVFVDHWTQTLVPGRHYLNTLLPGVFISGLIDPAHQTLIYGALSTFITSTKQHQYCTQVGWPGRQRPVIQGY